MSINSLMRGVVSLVLLISFLICSTSWAKVSPGVVTLTGEVHDLKIHNEEIQFSFSGIFWIYVLTKNTPSDNASKAEIDAYLKSLKDSEWTFPVSKLQVHIPRFADDPTLSKPTFSLFKKFSEKLEQPPPSGKKVSVHIRSPVLTLADGKLVHLKGSPNGYAALYLREAK